LPAGNQTGTTTQVSLSFASLEPFGLSSPTRAGVTHWDSLNYRERGHISHCFWLRFPSFSTNTSLEFPQRVPLSMESFFGKRYFASCFFNFDLFHSPFTPTVLLRDPRKSRPVFIRLVHRHFSVVPCWSFFLSSISSFRFASFSIR